MEPGVTSKNKLQNLVRTEIILGEKTELNTFSAKKLPSISTSKTKSKKVIYSPFKINDTKVKSLIKSKNTAFLQTSNSNVNYNLNVNSILVKNRSSISSKLKSNCVLDHRKFTILDIPSEVNIIQEKITEDRKEILFHKRAQ